jgi:osmoprotectant transport system substrate-binding protein
MNWKTRLGYLATAVAVVFTVAACGGTTPTPPASKGTLTIAGFGFSEGSVLAELYGQALQHAGYTVNYKLNLGNREIVGPAIKSGQIDLYIGYAATDLEYYNGGAGEASSDVTATTAKLNARLQPLGLQALTPSSAQDQNAFAMTKANSTKYNATKLSDLAPIGNQLILGGPPECPTRPFCALGLQKTYGITFKEIKKLDAGGPLTRAALKDGSIQVGLVFTSSAFVGPDGLVVLQDDKHLQNADNVVPIIRTVKASADATKVLNAVSTGLNSADLVALNAKVELDHQDPDAATKAYLVQHNYFS